MISMLNKYDWMNFVMGLFGVLVGAIITSYFASKREKRKLIKDLQIKAYEELLLQFNDYKDKLFTVCSIIQSIPQGNCKTQLKELINVNVQLYVPRKKLEQNIILKSSMFCNLDLNRIRANFSNLEEVLDSNINAIINFFKRASRTKL